MYQYFKLLVHFTIVVSIAFLIHYLINFQIPHDMRGWLMVSILTPLVTAFLSTSTWISAIHHSLVYSHTWDKDVNGGEVIDWFSVYMMKHKVWSYEHMTKIINNDRSIWWNEDDWKTRPQIFEIPSELVIFKYQGTYLLCTYPYPCVQHYEHSKKITHQISVYSHKKMDWKKFVEDVRDYYYNNLESEKMSYYKINYDMFGEDRQVIPIRTGASIDVCFGDRNKEKIWETVTNFLTPERKKRSRSLNQPHKTAFLIYGPPGTGKTEMLFQLASATWKDHRKPIYVVNPRGMSDYDLEENISNIQSGYILVNEWDMSLKKAIKQSESDKDENKDKEDTEYPSLKAWLDILDQSQGELIFWFTTNNYEKLAKINDGALIRDCRIDHRIEFGMMTPEQVRKALKHFTEDKEPEIDDLPDSQLENLNIAKIIAHLRYDRPLEEIGKD